MYIPTGVFQQSPDLTLVDLTVLITDKIVYNDPGEIASISLAVTGEAFTISSAGDIELATQWAAPREDHLGDGFEVRYETVSGTTPAGSATDTWLPLSEARLWSLTNASSDIFVGNLAIRPIDGDIVTTGVVTLQIGIPISALPPFASLTYADEEGVLIYGFGAADPGILPNPVYIPTGQIAGTSWSKNNRYLAMTTDTAPYLWIYDMISGTPVQLADPAIPPTGPAGKPYWHYSSSNLTLAIPHANSPYVSFYTLDSGLAVKFDDPVDLPTGKGNSVSFSTFSSCIGVAHDNSPYITIYDGIDMDLLVKKTNPVSLPPGPCTSIGAINPSTSGGFFGYFIVTHTSSPYVSIYSDGTYGTPTKQANPNVLPIGANCICKTGGGNWWSVSSSDSPYIYMYNTEGTGVNDLTTTKVANPATLPAGPATSVDINQSSADHLMVTHENSPFMTMYYWDYSTVLVKLPDPSILPEYDIIDGSWSGHTTGVPLP
jgi:hypothetical protein